MVDRKSHGDPINQLSARTWNSFIDAAEDFKRRKTSTPIRPTSNQRRTDIIDVRNDSPFTRAKGEVLELNGDFLLDRVEKDYLWFSGVAVTGSGNNFCVLEQPAAAGDIRPAQVSGVCVAQVNITSTSHNHAAPSSGSTVLVSGTVGPAKILHQPALTGEQTCVVLLGSAMAGELIWFRVESTGSNRCRTSTG